jgi:hypothetical protein
MILTAWIWVKSKIGMIVAIVGAAAVAFFSIRSAGKNAERAKQLEQVLKNVRTKDAVNQKVQRLPGGSAADRLRDKWSRD